MIKKLIARLGLASMVLALAVPLSLDTAPVVAQATTTTWKTSAVDNFTRKVSSSWGKAKKGGAYSATMSSGVSYRVKSGRGLVTGMLSGSRFTAGLPDSYDETTARSALLVTSGLTSALDLYHSFQVRRSADGQTFYAVTYRSVAGSRTLGISRVSNGVSTWLTGVKVPSGLSPSKKLWLEYMLTGTSQVEISARVWRSGAKKPAWQVSYTDDSSGRITAPGTVAIDDYVAASSKTVTVRHDNLLVKSRAGAETAGEPTPTPSATPTPSTTPTATASVSVPTGSDTGSRGTTLGSTSFSLPSGAIYVSASAGNDSTGIGSIDRPYRSVATAIAKASAGATVVLRGGTYHEQVVVDRALTIQNYPGEVVWFDGSTQLTSWTKSGSTWIATGWTATHSHTMGGEASRYVDSDNPMANYPDMVFVNGTGLKQVASASSVTSGTFYVSESYDKLVIGSDPNGQEVRASDLEQAIKVTVKGVTLQGFGVRRYATPYESRGAILSDPPNGVFRDLVVSDNATIGIAASNSSKVLDHLVVERNGLLGIGSDKGGGLSLTNSIVKDNNNEDFKTEPVAGGVKITSATDPIIANNEISDSVDANGLWLDVKTSGATIVSNSLVNNGIAQLEYEISKDATIANNVAIGGEMGILVFDSENVRMFNNEVGGQRLFGMKVAQDERYQTLSDSSFSLRSRNLVYSNNVFGCGKAFQFYALDGVTGISADKMNITINGNLFSKRVVTSDPTMVAWGKGDKVTLERYETPAALAAAKNPAWQNAQNTSCAALSDMDDVIGVSQGVAVGLPSDIAAALGVSSGYKRVGLIG